MYETILVGFDESLFSKAALKEASSWVKRHGGKIILVHAIYFDAEEFTTVPEQLERRAEVGKRICYQAQEDITSELGINIESLICEGEPPEVIVEIAQGKKADLIALGTYGRKGLKRLLMGSVTSSIIVNSPCDVLVVKKPCSECTGRYGSILLPFDGSIYSKKSLNRAFELSKIDGAEINVLYVIPRYEEMVEFFMTGAIRKSLYNEAEKVLASAKDMASGQGISIKTEIKEGNAAENIIETAEKQKNDLIIMGPYGYRGIDKAIMGSTTERVIANAACPVLCVR